MRADLRVVAAFAVLAGTAAAQQSTPQPAERRPERVEATAASDREDETVVETFLDWLKRNAEDPQQGSGDYWSRHGGGDGNSGGGGGGDSGGGGDH